MTVVDRPGPVTSLALSLLPHTDAVLVTWEPPDNLTTPLLGYVISYHVIGIGDCNSSYFTQLTSLPQLPGDSSSYVLAGLTSWLQYRVIVQAVNVAGAGQQSTADVIMRGSGQSPSCNVRR